MILALIYSCEFQPDLFHILYVNRDQQIKHLLSFDFQDTEVAASEPLQVLIGDISMTV